MASVIFRKPLLMDVVVAGFALGAGAYLLWLFPLESSPDLLTLSAHAEGTAAPATAPAALDLTDSQMASVKVEPVETREFPVEKEAVGSIDFNEDMETQVFTPYPGRIISLFASVGDDVKKGQKLFTIDSPDLLAAESNLIAAADVLELTTRNLARLRELYKTLAVSQKELEQGISDQPTASPSRRSWPRSATPTSMSAAAKSPWVSNRSTSAASACSTAAAMRI
jgi:membrane fusion protein, heavy metal efflux system